jgi:hypothetical protein
MRVVNFERPFGRPVVKVAGGSPFTETGMEPSGKLRELTAHFHCVGPDSAPRINHNIFDQAKLRPHWLNERTSTDDILKSPLFGEYGRKRTEGGTIY